MPQLLLYSLTHSLCCGPAAARRSSQGFNNGCGSGARDFGKPADLLKDGRMKKDKTASLACQIAKPAIQQLVKTFKKDSA